MNSLKLSDIPDAFFSIPSLQHPPELVLPYIHHKKRGQFPCILHKKQDISGVRGNKRKKR
jgi:hypothetical protein